MTATVKRPVPGQLLLTTAEFAELARLLDNQVTQHLSPSFGRSNVRRIVAALNRSRLGTPPGEVRRSKNGSLAIRGQRPDGSLFWEVPHLADGDDHPKTVADLKNWSTIHPASWDQLVVETDFVALQQDPAAAEGKAS